jgi:hypothetical protein
LCFNPAGEILLGASRWKRNNVKLVNIPALNVYQNWPDFKTVFRYSNCVGFSSDSKLLAIGNETGNVVVYKFKHYE